jgi:hypothetical protein
MLLRVTEEGLAVVERAGLAKFTLVCSVVALFSVAALLFASPE